MITIQPMTPVHMNAVYAVEQDCFSSPWSLRTLCEEQADKHMISYVALDAAHANAIAGYTFMRHIPNPDPNDASTGEGHIENIAVAPAYRQQGVGALLMQALAEEAERRAFASITLEVRQGNRAAMALYHKFGFKVLGYRRAYYTLPTEDAIIMTKDLSRTGLTTMDAGPSPNEVPT